MKFADYLSEEQIRQFNQLRRSSKNQKEHKPKKDKGYNPGISIIDESVVPKKKKKEKLSSKDIEELMGTRRETFKRVRGAVRRK